MHEQDLIQELRVGGAIIFSRIGPSNRAKLVDGLTAAGLDKFIPEERTEFSALQGALQTVYKKSGSKKDGVHILVRPLEDKAGFAVVKEVRGDQVAGNGYESTLTATVPSDTLPIKMQGNYAVEDYEAVVEAYAVCKNVVGTSAVSRCLDRIIESLGGVDLTAGRRNRGRHSSGDKKKADAKGGTKALWWLHKEKIEKLRAVAAVIEDAGIPKSEEDDDGQHGPKESCNRVNVITCIADDSMIRAVGDGLVTEVGNDLAQINYDLEHAELTPRMMGNRRKKAEDLTAKVERYEQAFGVYLAKLHEDLDKVKTATAVAVLLESAASTEPALVTA